MINYFESIEMNDARRDYGYLLETPKKEKVLNNAQIDGYTAILPNSNNRALTIATKDKIFLQSYDTLILSINTTTGAIEKLFSGYSVTTLKHINEFLRGYGLQFNKKSWEKFNGCTL